MPNKKMARTTYVDPTNAGKPVRGGDTTHGESNLDFEGFLQPLEQAHASGLHDWGVAQGLRTTATLGAAGVAIEPGIAVDVDGHHISLAPSSVDQNGNPIPSYAETATVDPPLPSVPALIAATGVTLPTVTSPPLPAGDYYATVQFLEVLDQAALGGAVWRLNLMPWLRLRPATGFVDNGKQIVLAKVKLTATGNVTSLTHEFRRVVGMPAQQVRLRGAVTSSAAGKTSSAETDSAALRVRRDGAGAPAGAELVTAKATDEIHLKADGVAPGIDATAAKIQLSATTITARNAAGNDTVTIASANGDVTAAGAVTAGGTVTAGRVVAPGLVARRADGRETVVVDAQLGNVTAGVSGVEGDVLVQDGAGARVITLDGGAADIVVGGQGNSGNVRVWDSQRVEQVNIDGAAGNLWYRGDLCDLAAPGQPGITHPQLRELVGGANTGLHRHANSGNVTNAVAVILHNNEQMPLTQLTISLPFRQRVFAYIAITSFVFQGAANPPGLVESYIRRVDGQSLPGSDFDHPFYVGAAQSVEFALSSPYSFVEAWALAVVLPEG